MVQVDVRTGRRRFVPTGRQLSDRVMGMTKAIGRSQLQLAVEGEPPDFDHRNGLRHWFGFSFVQPLG